MNRRRDHRSRMVSHATALESDTIDTRPLSGTRLRSMLQPFHPVLRAVGPRGFRGTMASGERDWRCTAVRFPTTSRSMSHSIKSRFGVLADVIVSSKVSYCPSFTQRPKWPAVLFSSYGSSQRPQEKSRAFVF
jgi:hypothetical protein